MTKLSIVVPVYNEESVLHEFMTRILKVMESLKNDYEFELIFSLDPSSDQTEAVLQGFCQADPRIKYLKFSRRVGQPLATVAGIEHAEGEACIIIDVDLQDPPELIPSMIEKWEAGYDVVLPQRRSRKGETWVKIFVSFLGYSLMNKITSIRIPREIGDFRLISRRVMEELKKIKEHHGFLRGMVADIGFKQITLPYDREYRLKGRSKYNPFVGSLRIGLNSLVCYSTFLLSLSYLAGFGMIVASLLSLIAGLMGKHDLFFIVSLVLFVCGLQSVLMGILGEYVGRIYEEVRERPRYLIDKKVNF